MFSYNIVGLAGADGGNLMNSIEFLDAVRETHGLDSDNKLADLLEINRGKLSAYRTGTRKLAPVDCRKIAKALDVPSAYVLAEIQAERAKEPEDRADWKMLAGLAKKGKAAVVGAVAIIGLSTSPIQDASAAAVSADNFSHDNLYIMRIRAFIKRWLNRHISSRKPQFLAFRATPLAASVMA